MAADEVLSAKCFLKQIDSSTHQGKEMIWIYLIAVPARFIFVCYPFIVVRRK